MLHHPKIICPFLEIANARFGPLLGIVVIFYAIKIPYIENQNIVSNFWKNADYFQLLAF